MPPDTPLNKGHQHATNAEDYISRGLLIPAAEEHYKSAEAFLQCLNEANDEGIKRTLRMLYMEHNKAGKELQRKIAKLQEEGKDPSLPQPPTPLIREQQSQRQLGSSPSLLPANALSQSTMAESNYPIGESYMMLGQQAEPQDTFTHFWDILEGMLDNLSQPIAFATAPLARSEVTEASRKYNSKSFISESDKSNIPKSMNQLRVGTETEFDDFELADEDSLSEESFFIVPSATTPLNANLLKEIDALNAQIIVLQQKLEISERMRNEQEEQLRERIELARREAQRVRSSGFLPSRVTAPLDFNPLNVNISPMPVLSHVTVTRENQLNRRVKEVEEELRLLKIESEKQKQIISKFRERWEKLKESAKRKKMAKVNISAERDVREQRIDEDPEAEAAATDLSFV